MAYEATAELYRRQYDLAKKRAQSEYDSRIGQLAEQYRQANRDLEGNLESRGILRSGEGMRGRVRLGAAEKSAQLAALTAQEEAMNQAGLTYAQQLAELQAKGYTDGGTPGTPTPAAPDSPGTQAPRSPGTQAPPPAQQRPPAPSGSTPGGSSGTLCAPGYFYDPIKKICVKESDLPTVGGRPVPPGQTPSETIGVPPTITRPPTVGGVPVRPGDTPSETKLPDLSGVDWAGLGKIIGYKPPVTATPIKGRY